MSQLSSVSLQQSMYDDSQNTVPFLNSQRDEFLNRIQESLRSWKPTQKLNDAKIRLVALNILKEGTRKTPIRYSNPLFEGSLALPSEDLLIKAEPVDLGPDTGIRGFLVLKGGKIPVIYLKETGASKNGGVGVASGSFKIVLRSLEITFEERGVSTSFVALVKPKIKEFVSGNSIEMLDAKRANARVRNLKAEALLLKECEHRGLTGIIRLNHLFHYFNAKGVQKIRMVLPWYEEGDLVDIQQKITSPEKWEVCTQLLKIIAALEQKGCIFRDIKPENVLVRRDLKGEIEIALCDTGFTRFSHEASVPSLVGSPFWLAPEYVHLGLESHSLLAQKNRLDTKWEALEEKSAALREKRIEWLHLSAARKLRKVIPAKENFLKPFGWRRWNRSKQVEDLLEKSRLLSERKLCLLEQLNRVIKKDEELRRKLVEWTTSKLDVWGAALICAAFLSPRVWSEVAREGGLGDSMKDQSLAFQRWFSKSQISCLEELDQKDPLEQLLKEMLHPIPEERLSAAESLKRFLSLRSYTKYQK